MTLAKGSVINQRYRVVGLLGQGGFGAVYRVWDINLERPLALKENLETSQAAQRQFKREAQILFDLSHPNLPRVIDLFVVDDLGQYLVMEFVEGEDLEKMMELSAQPLPLEQALEWTGQICDALDYLHGQQQPIIHRDIKPANIRITKAGKAMLVDFGIAKVYDASTKTTQGARAVTPGFSPLEQYGQGQTDARSDVYALGATLYFLLTNQHPPASVDRISQRTGELRPAFIVNPRLPQGISVAIDQAMMLECEARFSSAGAFKRALLRGKTMLVLPASPQAPQVSPSLSAVNADNAIDNVKMAQTPLMHAAAKPASDPASVTPSGTMKVSDPLSPISDISQAKASQQPSQPRQAEQQKPSRGRLVWTLLGAGLFFLILLALAIGTLVGYLPHARQRTDDMHLLAALPSSVPANLLDKRKVPMALIPGGEFMMGAEDGQRDERPVHTVKIDPFYLDQYEVTNGRYAECVQAGECEPPAFSSTIMRQNYLFWKGYYGEGIYNRFPVVYVDWYMAKAYCEWRGGRLPTEAEWEMAARGGLEGALYPWGSQTESCEGTNFANCVGDTVPVGSYAPNAYGLYDMAGNVNEWVADWYAENYYGLSIIDNPVGPGAGEYHVVRGGAYNSSGQEICVSYRNAVGGAGTTHSLGFRCIRPEGE